MIRLSGIICVTIVWIFAVVSYPIIFGTSLYIIAPAFLLLIVIYAIIVSKPIVTYEGEMAKRYQYLLASLIDLFIASLGMSFGLAFWDRVYWLGMVVSYLFVSCFLLRNIWYRSVGFLIFRLRYTTSDKNNLAPLKILFSNSLLYIGFGFASLALSGKYSTITSSLEHLSNIFNGLLILDIVHLVFSHEKRRFLDKTVGLSVVKVK
jgi:hypothetical protein